MQLSQVVDVQRPAGGGEDHGELGGVEGGHDGDEDPPGAKQDPASQISRQSSMIHGDNDRAELP